MKKWKLKPAPPRAAKTCRKTAMPQHWPLIIFLRFILKFILKAKLYIFHPLIYSPCDYHSQDWHCWSLEPGANPSLPYHIEHLHTWVFSSAFPGTLTGCQMGSVAVEAWTTGIRCPYKMPASQVVAWWNGHSTGPMWLLVFEYFTLQVLLLCLIM